MRAGLLGLFCLASVSAYALELPSRSISTSRQFIVYCDNTSLRMQVTSFAEQTKSTVLDLLEDTGTWAAPIVIQIVPEQTALPGLPASSVNLYATEEGPKIQIDVRVGKDPAAISFQTQIIRALLLELMYREKGPRGGERYVEPPAWIVEGISERARRLRAGSSDSIFETFAEASRLPPVESVMTSAAGEPGSTWNQIFRAFSLSLLDLLIEQPGGRKALLDYLRDLRDAPADPVAALGKFFPVVGKSRESLEKWWTLSMAKYAIADRYVGMNAPDTDRELEKLLTVEFPAAEDGGEPVRCRWEDFEKYIKQPEFRTALQQREQALAALSSKANPLFRTVITEYQQIAALLGRGKGKRVAERLKAVAEYRQAVLKRVDEVADYLNWVEATQMGTRSHAFDSYLKAATEAEQMKVRRDDPVTRYLNLVEAITQ